MTGRSPTSQGEPGRRLQAIADELVAAGLSVQLHRTRAGLDLTAALHHPGLRETDVLVDEDGYTELRYWADQAAAPAQVADIIVRVLSVVSDIRAASTPPDPACTPPHTEAFSVLRLPAPAIGTITGYDGAVTERAGDGGMTGSKDTPTEQQVSADSVRKNWPDKADPELVKRLEQLQPGHPSSPYKADGTRKPPVPDRRSDELSIPDDPDYRPDTPTSTETDQATAPPDRPTKNQASGPEGELDKELPTEDSPQTGTDGSWAWKGCRLTPDQSRCGDQGVASCREAEGRDADGRYGDHGLTPAMHRIEAQLDHGKLVPETEKFALKGADRFKEKLWELIRAEPDKPAEELAKEIHDGIRYTFFLDPENYVDGAQEICDKLKENSYELGVIKNVWGNDEYKGVNTRWLDPHSGLRFEVQLHTEHSWQVKQQTHDAYEKINDARTPSEERERLRNYQREANAEVVPPPRWDEILDYRREGW